MRQISGSLAAKHSTMFTILATTFFCLLCAAELVAR